MARNSIFLASQAKPNTPILEWIDPPFYSDPIESVKLRLKGVKTKITKNTSSDADGFFELTDLDEDVYMVFATKKRYKNYQKTIKLEEGQEKKIEIEMRRFVNR